MKRTDLVEALVNKMLEKYGVDYNFVFNNPRINGIEWFRYYSFTPKEDEAFKEWAIKFIKKHKRCSMHYAKQLYSWFSLFYGLTISKEEDVDATSESPTKE